MQFDFEIDKLTHSLEDTITGEIFLTEILSLKKHCFLAKNWNIVIKTPALKEGFGVRWGAVLWDALQDFGSSPLARTFANPL